MAGSGGLERTETANDETANDETAVNPYIAALLPTRFHLCEGGGTMIRFCPRVILANWLLAVFASTATLAAQQQTLETFSSGPKQKNRIDFKQVDGKKLPTIVYGNPRESDRWVKTTDGSSVAVDDCIEYDGLQYFLALTWHVVAVDPKTEQTVWSKNVSAFWNQMSIEIVNLEGAEESRTAVLALRTGRDDETKDQVQYYDLKSGASITDPNKKADELGEPVKPTAVHRGSHCNRSEPLLELVSSQAGWHEIYDLAFADVADAPPRENLFDEATQALLVVISGDSTNCAGISPHSIHENNERVLVRLNYHTYQTDGNPPTVQPYGVFALPKFKSKKYVLQRNRQRFIGGPAIWKDWKTLQIDEP